MRNIFAIGFRDENSSGRAESFHMTNIYVVGCSDVKFRGCSESSRMMNVYVIGIERVKEKKTFVIRIENLNQALKHGLKLKKAHRVIRSKKSSL